MPANYGCMQQQQYMQQMMQMMNMPTQYAPMAAMPQDQMEAMYPRVYYIIYPAICQQCNMMGIQPGTMVTPTKEQMDAMVDSVYDAVAPEAEAEMVDGEETGSRQFGFGGFGRRRRFLRDLIGILLIRELLGRHHSYGYGYGYGYPGYY